MRRGVLTGSSYVHGEQVVDCLHFENQVGWGLLTKLSGSEPWWVCSSRLVVRVAPEIRSMAAGMRCGLIQVYQSSAWRRCRAYDVIRRA